MSYSDAEKLACVKRELALRERVYPRFVEKGRMKLDESRRQIELMKSIVDDYAQKVSDGDA